MKYKIYVIDSEAFCVKNPSKLGWLYSQRPIPSKFESQNFCKT